MDSLAALAEAIAKAGLIKPGKPHLLKRVGFLLRTGTSDRAANVARYLTSRKRGLGFGPKGKRRRRTGDYTGVYATGVNKSEAAMADCVEELKEAIAKARYKISGGVGVSSKQRRTIAMQNATGANARDRGPDKSTANQRPRKAPSWTAGSAQRFKRMQAAGRAKGASREDKKWAKTSMQNARWKINNDRQRRGLAPSYKRGTFGGLKPRK